MVELRRREIDVVEREPMILPERVNGRRDPASLKILCGGHDELDGVDGHRRARGGRSATPPDRPPRSSVIPVGVRGGRPAPPIGKRGTIRDRGTFHSAGRTVLRPEHHRAAVLPLGDVKQPTIGHLPGPGIPRATARVGRSGRRKPTRQVEKEPRAGSIPRDRGLFPTRRLGCVPGRARPDGSSRTRHALRRRQSNRANASHRFIRSSSACRYVGAVRPMRSPPEWWWNRIRPFHAGPGERGTSVSRASSRSARSVTVAPARGVMVSRSANRGPLSGNPGNRAKPPSSVSTSGTGTARSSSRSVWATWRRSGARSSPVYLFGEEQGWKVVGHQERGGWRRAPPPIRRPRPPTGRR